MPALCIITAYRCLAWVQVVETVLQARCIIRLQPRCLLWVQVVDTVLVILILKDVSSV